MDREFVRKLQTKVELLQEFHWKKNPEMAGASPSTCPADPIPAPLAPGGLPWLPSFTGPVPISIPYGHWAGDIMLPAPVRNSTGKSKLLLVMSPEGAFGS